MLIGEITIAHSIVSCNNRFDSAINCHKLAESDWFDSHDAKKRLRSNIVESDFSNSTIILLNYYTTFAKYLSKLQVKAWKIFIQI